MIFCLALIQSVLGIVHHSRFRGQQIRGSRQSHQTRKRRKESTFSTANTEISAFSTDSSAPSVRESQKGEGQGPAIRTSGSPNGVLRPSNSLGPCSTTREVELEDFAFNALKSRRRWLDNIIRRTTIFGVIHRYIGRFLITLAIINGGLGIQLQNRASTAQRFGYGIAATMMWLLYIVTVSVTMRRKRQATTVSQRCSSPPELSVQRPGSSTDEEDGDSTHDTTLTSSEERGQQSRQNEKAYSPCPAPRKEKEKALRRPRTPVNTEAPDLALEHAASIRRITGEQSLKDKAQKEDVDALPKSPTPTTALPSAYDDAYQRTYFAEDDQSHIHPANRTNHSQNEVLTEMNTGRRRSFRRKKMAAENSQKTQDDPFTTSSSTPKLPTARSTTPNTIAAPGATAFPSSTSQLDQALDLQMAEIDSQRVRQQSCSQHQPAHFKRNTNRPTSKTLINHTIRRPPPSLHPKTLQDLTSANPATAADSAAASASASASASKPKSSPHRLPKSRSSGSNHRLSLGMSLDQGLGIDVEELEDEMSEIMSEWGNSHRGSECSASPPDLVEFRRQQRVQWWGRAVN